MPLDNANDIVSQPGVQIVMAGAMGGLVRWFRLKEIMADGLRSVAIGAICAYHMSEVVLPIFDPILVNAGLSPESRLSFAAFIVGFSGTAIAGFFKDVLTSKGNFPRDADTKGKDE